MPASSDIDRQLLAGIQELALPVDAGVRRRLLDYLSLLQRWNRSFNLTAVRDPAAMVTRHLLDSLALLPHLRGKSAIDLGSGAGLPGLVLALAAPEHDWLLVDSNGKKARFLRAAKRELQIANITVVEARVENLTGSFDLVTARAFTQLDHMLELGGHLLAPGGTWLAMKGQLQEAELSPLPPDFAIAEVVPLKIPGLDAQRHLVILRRRPPDAPSC